MNNKPNLEEITKFCKKKGIVFQSAEIYGGLAGFFDFGPLGVEIKNNFKQQFWKEFVKKREDVVGQDGSIITNPKVWSASGHIDSFGDLVLTTKETKTKIRADHFIEDTLDIPADGMSAEDINELIKKHNLKYKGEEFEEVKDFNLMFQTQVGADITKNATAYLRPETAQSIFPNFKLASETSRLQLPFGIAQIGKAFRNEISPRDFVFRCREFEQIELEYFFNPEEKIEIDKDILNQKVQFLSAKKQENQEDEIIEITFKELLEDPQYKLNSYHIYWLSNFFNWFKNEINLSYENLRIREHTQKELSHYSKATFDIDYKYPMGFKELLGMANRTNFDLSRHMEHSNSKLEIFDEKTKTKIVPHVIEPSFGIERALMALLVESYNQRDETIYLELPYKIAPNDVGVFPLMNKPELTNKSREIFNKLLDEDINAIFDKSGSVGKRYARQDEQGTPFCITVDYETIEEGENKNTVTIREAKSKEQKRINIENIADTIKKLKNNKIKFNEL